jgi:hypothetical protein
MWLIFSNAAPENISVGIQRLGEVISEQIRKEVVV